MSQCVPVCHTDTDDTSTTPRFSTRSTGAADTHMLEYEVAELTWENGQVSLHGLGPPRMPSKYSTGGGTLESIVDQATRLPIPPDALVPSSPATLKRPRLLPDQFSMSGSETVGRDQSRRLTIDTFDTGFTSPDNTSTKTTTIDDHDSVCHSRPQREDVGGKSSVSTKRSRAAAIHNQSERKRRDKINQRMKTLQKMVPNSSKTDKASMLDEVIEYLKQLQGQVSMMSRMNMASPMMLPTMAAMQQHHHQQQQQHFSLLSNPMGLGLGLGMGMPGLGLAAGNMMPMSTPFMPPPASNDTRYHSPHILPAPDPMAAFLACSSQPSTMEAYSRMAALYQQMHQQLPPPSNPK